MTRLVLSFALAASCAACASVFGFEEPTGDKIDVAADAGVAPSSTSTSTSTSTVDSAPFDAGASAPVDSGAAAKREGVPIDAEAGVSLEAGAQVCVCAPAVADWQGPFVVARKTGGEPARCDGAYPTEIYAGFNGLNAPDAQCSCSCGSPTDVACSTPATTFFSDAACTTTCSTQTTALACAAVSSYSCDLLSVVKPKAMMVGASTASGGSCSASATATIPAQTWSSAIRLCGGAPAACEDGGCPAAPSAGFSAANRCVMKAGDNACPAGFPAKTVYHEGGTDTRACTACSCGAPVAVSCIANVETFGPSCTGKPSAATVTPSGCLALSGGGHLTVEAATAQGGSCSPSGGVPIGGFTEDAPTTVCCLE